MPKFENELIQQIDNFENQEDYDHPNARQRRGSKLIYYIFFGAFIILFLALCIYLIIAYVEGLYPFEHRGADNVSHILSNFIKAFSRSISNMFESRKVDPYTDTNSAFNTDNNQKDY